MTIDLRDTNECFRLVFYLTVIIILLVSCSSGKRVSYFPGVQNDTFFNQISIPEPVIQTNDILAISVSSRSAEASSVFNVASAVPSEGAGGYLVDREGNIEFPLLGKISAKGLSKDRLRAAIAAQLVDKKLLVDPVITIRHLNFRITVLGEVGKPAVITIPNERITLLEALGFAGDITIYGKRDNVLLIREENNQKLTHRLNLNSDTLLRSDFYYLKSNDVLYVEPTKARVSSASRTQQWLPILLSGLGLAVIVVDRLVK